MSAVAQRGRRRRLDSWSYRPAGICEPPAVVLGTKLGSPEEQQALLAAEQSLLPQTYSASRQEESSETVTHGTDPISHP